jgi:hypothetical protein
VSRANSRFDAQADGVFVTAAELEVRENTREQPAHSYFGGLSLVNTLVDLVASPPLMVVSWVLHLLLAIPEQLLEFLLTWLPQRIGPAPILSVTQFSLFRGMVMLLIAYFVRSHAAPVGQVPLLGELSGAQAAALAILLHSLLSHVHSIVAATRWSTSASFDEFFARLVDRMVLIFSTLAVVFVNEDVLLVQLTDQMTVDALLLSHVAVAAVMFSAIVSDAVSFVAWALRPALARSPLRFPAPLPGLSTVTMVSIAHAWLLAKPHGARYGPYSLYIAVALLIVAALKECREAYLHRA